MSTRFYKQSSPTFVDDKMYAPPVETMVGALAIQDKRAEEAQVQFKELDTLLQKVEELEQDTPEIRAAIAEHKANLASATEGIHGNMEQFNKMFPTLRNISLDINKDLFDGIFKASGEQVKAKTDLGTYIDENYKDLETANMLKKFADKIYEFEGGLKYDKKTGKHNKYMDSTELDFKDWIPEVEAGLVNLVPEKRTTQEPYLNKEENISSSVTTHIKGIFHDQVITKRDLHIDSSDARKILINKYTKKAVVDDITDEEFIDYVSSNVEKDLKAFSDILEGQEGYEETTTGSKSFGTQARDDARMKREGVGISLTVPSIWRTKAQGEILTKYETELATIFFPNDFIGKTSEDVTEKLKISYDGDTNKMLAGLVERGFADTSEAALIKLEEMQYFKDLNTTYTTDVYGIKPGDAKDEDLFNGKINMGNSLKVAIYNMFPTLELGYRYTDENGVLQSGVGRLEDIFPNGITYTPVEFDYTYDTKKDETKTGTVSVKKLTNPNFGETKTIVAGKIPGPTELDFYTVDGINQKDRAIEVDYDEIDPNTGEKKYKGVIVKDSYVIRGNFMTMPNGTVSDNFREVELFIPISSIKVNK